MAQHQAPLRTPSHVMRLARMGASHRTRLSFLRALLRRIESEKWRFERREWALDAKGVGHAVYTVHTPLRAYSLVAFSHDLPDEMRSDRVIATAWDATFTLFDGIPSTQDIVRLGANVPKQEMGRVSDRELTLARANRSVRLWDTVINSLANGQQPEMDAVAQVGYLMRTTAVYGSGKFGAADRSHTAWRDELAGPFRAEMLTVWLIRQFTFDCVDHLAKQRGGSAAVTLSAENARRIGVGNSTGLGMAPFLLNHPALLHQWVQCRETALARVRGVATATPEQVACFQNELTSATRNAAEWGTDHPLQIDRLATLRSDLAQLQAAVTAFDFTQATPWDALFKWGEAHLGLEGQEQLAALLMEPFGELVDALADQMGIDETGSFHINGGMPLTQLNALLQSNYRWVDDIAYDSEDSEARFWYVSEEKLEPRLGDRFHEDGAELELPLCAAKHIKALQADLTNSAHNCVAGFLREHPEHRLAVRRVQICADHPYAEIQDNLVGADMLPIDLLRCKLAFFGATKFDPRSDRWVRISLYQDAPLPTDICGITQTGQSGQLNGEVDTSADDVARYSLAEIEALSKRAARGAGLSWGLAEEVGKAVRWLQAHGQPGVAALNALLRSNDGISFNELCPQLRDGTWAAESGVLCPLIAGATVLDHASLDDQWPLNLQQVRHPLLIVPFVARAAVLSGVTLAISWSDHTLLLSPSGAIKGDAPNSSDPEQAVLDRLVLRQASAAEATTLVDGLWRKSALAQPIPADEWSALEAVAHRTLVPATSVSRAGAGSTAGDND
ncbi:DUF3726 domain-containing protein [Burkholderiaceae bacterium]|nr:DUF3726 domain-containing protein [Burkholderiaceae bacterium]